MTVGEKIVVHLSQYVHQHDAFVCPPEMGQSGIAECLSISRAHAAIELRRQMDAGRILMRVAHVTGAPTRRKVYHLTARGAEVARTVRDRAARRTLVLVYADGTEETMEGGRILWILRRQGLREGRAVWLILTQSRIDLREPLATGPNLGSNPSLRFGFDAAFVRPGVWQLAVVLGPPHVPPIPAGA